MKTSDSIDKIAPALVAASADIGGAVKASVNPHFRSSYAGLPEVIAAVKTAALGAGIVIIQAPGPVVDGKVQLTTRLQHSSGQWIETTAEAPIGAATAQAYGSCITYLRRYSIAALFNVPQVDDDGNSASQAAGGAQGSGGRVTSGQAGKLSQALSERSSDALSKFCDYFGIETVSELPADQYKRACGLLKVAP